MESELLAIEAPKPEAPRGADGRGAKWKLYAHGVPTRTGSLFGVIDRSVAPTVVGKTRGSRTVQEGMPMRRERDLTPEEIAALPLLLGFGTRPSSDEQSEPLIKSDPSGNTLSADGSRVIIFRD